MVILTQATEASDFTPHCPESNNVSFSYSDCGQILHNNWFTILKRSTAPRVFTVLQTTGARHDPDSSLTEVQPRSPAHMPCVFVS